MLLFFLRCIRVSFFFLFTKRNTFPQRMFCDLILKTSMVKKYFHIPHGNCTGRGLSSCQLCTSKVTLKRSGLGNPTPLNTKVMTVCVTVTFKMKEDDDLTVTSLLVERWTSLSECEYNTLPQRKFNAGSCTN